MSYPTMSAVEIDHKLREDFRRRLREFGVSAETTDPVLGVLFRTFAQQLETLYSETGRIRLALLDELIAGLGVERRMARPAQTVVRFLTASGPQLIEVGTELVGEASSGERLSFATDATVATSGARIAIAAIYQDGALRLMQGVEMPESLQAQRPSLDPVRVNLGPSPAVYLAIEKLPPDHLSRHSLFFELGPDADAIQLALQTEPWCLFGVDGELGAPGILRPHRANAGIMALNFLIQEAAISSGTPMPLSTEPHAPVLPDGFHGSRIFVLPVIPPLRRFQCRMPRGMDLALGRLFGGAAAQLFAEPRAWLRIALPKDISPLHLGISSVAMHAITASNVECLNETVYFDRHGTSIPISREGGTSSHLVAPLSIFGESGTEYLPEFSPSSDKGAGRYRILNGRLEFQPAKRPDGTPDAYVNVRVWTTSGALGNRVGPGEVESFLKKGTVAGVRVANPTSAAGGTDSEGYPEARIRFAEAILSRDRIVTTADLNTAARSFDRRIVKAKISSGLRRSEQGLHRVQKVVCALDRNAFVDPEVEMRYLREDLDGFLRQRFLYDTELALELEWV